MLLTPFIVACVTSLKNPEVLLKKREVVGYGSHWVGVPTGSFISMGRRELILVLMVI